MQQWFNNLTRQEQLMLVIAGAAVFVYLLFVLVLRPMSASADNLLLQNQRTAESLQTVRALAAEYKQLQKNGPVTSSAKQNLTRLIDNTVKKNELVMSRFQPSSSGDVQVRFENSVYADVIAWLNEVEVSNGINIKDLSISPGNASGLVNVSVRLRQGS
ncbi:MAG: general secretion pathway protein M [Oceanicoccus sp.]|jgi:general secretion pathway protein M